LNTIRKTYKTFIDLASGLRVKIAKKRANSSIFKIKDGGLFWSKLFAEIPHSLPLRAGDSVAARFVGMKRERPKTTSVEGKLFKFIYLVKIRKLGRF